MLKNIPTVTKLSLNVIRILGCNPGFYTLQGTNTYLIGQGEKRILFDTGENNVEYIDVLKKVLNENNIKIGVIIISHWHSDHLGGLKNIINAFDLKDVQVYKIKNEEKDVKDFNFNYIKDEYILNYSNVSLKLIHTPGHTKDHLIGYFENENTIFSGDCILGQGSSTFEHLKSYLDSLKKILNLNPSLIYPGHGPEIDKPVEKINHYINHRLKKEKSLINALPQKKDQCISVSELYEILYKDQNIPPQLYKGCIYNINNHLEKLLEESIAMEEIINDEKKYWKII